MSKNLRPINGLSKIMMNGIEKLNLNSEKISVTNGTTANGSANSSMKSPKTVCNSANCCGIYVKDFSNIVENYHNNSINERNGEKLQPESNLAAQEESSEYDVKPSLNDLNQKVWYMCDDDKIKIMTQREFEEALSKNQKVMITPYLLFYARYDAKNLKNSDYD
jgi:hypothetical protein